jgi:hypothetical protein
MDLQAKFLATTSSKRNYTTGTLKKNTEYSITHAWRAASIVMFVLLDIHDYTNSEQIVLLPFHYAVMVSDDVIKLINEDKIWLNLICIKNGELEIV